MKERSMKQVLAKNNGITIVDDSAADHIRGKRETTLLWRQLLWEFTDGTVLNKNILHTMECFDIIKITLSNCDMISPNDQRTIRRVIGQMSKRSHVLLIVRPGVDIGKDHGEQIPLLDKLNADTLREEM